MSTSWCPPFESNLGGRGPRNFGRITHFARAARVGNSTHAAPSHEVVLVREGRGGGPRGDVRLVENVADVPVDGLLAEEQLLRDRLVGLAGGDQAQDLKLAGGEPARGARRRGLVGVVRRRAQP